MPNLAPCRLAARCAFLAACCVLVAACSGGTSAGADTHVPDSAADLALPDVPLDAPAEAVRDGAGDADARSETALDAAPEPGLDDAGGDVAPLDVPSDAGPDTIADAPPPDAPADAPTDVADPGADGAETPEPTETSESVDAGDADDETGPAPCAACAAYGPVADTGTIGAAALYELSGLGASRSHPGVFYAHADSGDSARFFAFDLDGTPRGEFHLVPDPGAQDWEDLSMGPCDAGWCLYLGDIGDNLESRPGYTVYVVPEPAALDAVEPVDVPYVALPFRYPDGSHNSETLLVHPQSGDVYTVRKSSSAWDVYKLPAPHTPGLEAVLVKIGKVPAPGFLAVATGGDIHPCGDRVLLRSYGQLVELRLGQAQAFDAIFSNAGVPVPVAAEPQGEAAAYDADGLGYLTVSEGAGAVIHHVECEP